jgi:hypothetical protein
MKINFKATALALALMTGTVGYAAAQNWGYHDRDDYRYDRDDYRGYDRGYDFRAGMHEAREHGFQDGAQVAREDVWRGKPFNPNPRGHNHCDNGYSRGFGSLHEYREHYAEAYHQGYASAFRDGRYYR